MDYSIISVMLPMGLLGSLIGVELNVVFPSAVLAILITIILVSLAFFSLCKALQMWRAETRKKKELAHEEAQTKEAQSLEKNEKEE